MPEPRPPRRTLEERFELWLLRSFVWSRRRPVRPARTPVPEHPIGPADRPATVRIAMFGLAAVAPILVASALIPLRNMIAAPTAALVMVLPVVGVALIVPRTASLIAAITAALAFDVLLTEPYYSITIDAADDVEAAIVLGLIGVIVATIVFRELDTRSRSESRGREITALEQTVRALSAPDPDHLVEVVTGQLTNLLDLRTCDWSPGFHGRVGKLLARDGSIEDWKEPGLPDLVEVPVIHRGNEFGRLLLRDPTDRPVSNEERSTVLALADLLALGLERR